MRAGARERLPVQFFWFGVDVALMQTRKTAVV
jgi:hypothetical protein